jgi:hypothetical protein
MPAPELQPDVTEPETTGAQALGMGEQEADNEEVHTARTSALPEHKPWGAAGWIFQDGDCVAIERQGDPPRPRVLAD